MDLSAFSFEVCQPNGTVRRLIDQVLSEVGARALEPADEAQLADFLIFDVSAQELPARHDRHLLYRELGRPVLLCGLRRQRADHEELDEPGLVWLDRPFSASALLFQCASLLDVEPTGIITKRPVAEHTQETREEPVRAMLATSFETPTHEVPLDDAALLEEQFGLEPGVLGGAPSVASNATRELPYIEEATSITVIEDDGALIEGLDDIPQESGIFEVLEQAAGGKVCGKVQSQHIDLNALRDLSLSAKGVSVYRSPTLSETMPERPAARLTEAEALMDLTVVGELSSQPELAAAQSFSDQPKALPRLDEETSLEIQSFARMLADAWLRIGLSARVEDRSDRISRIMHALFEQGLEGAARELQRIPAAEGLSGSLRAVSLIGLFRTIRDRKLRGRLEIASQERAYVLYVDQGTLVEIDSLSDDHDMMMVQILREHGALDEHSCQRLTQEYAADEFAPPIEMKLRMEGLVSEATLQQARVLRARRIFAQVCQARSGTFAFIEVYAGDNHAWPVHELKLSVDELLLALMREAPVETGVSEATARHSLWLDQARLSSMNVSALTAQERDVLRFFREGGTLAQALQSLPYSAEELRAVLSRLKQAELLRQIDAQLRISSEQDAYRSGGVPAAPQPAAGFNPAPTQERTVITEISSSLRELMLPGAGEPASSYGSTSFDGPTRTNPAHHMPIPEELDPSDRTDEIQRSDRELDRLFREALGQDDLLSNDDLRDLLDPELNTFQREDD